MDESISRLEKKAIGSSICSSLNTMIYVLFDSTSPVCVRDRYEDFTRYLYDCYERIKLIFECSRPLIAYYFASTRFLWAIVPIGYVIVHNELSIRIEYGHRTFV